MQHLTRSGAPTSLRRDGSPANILPAQSKDRAPTRVSLFKGYRKGALARNLAARKAAPAKGR